MRSVVLAASLILVMSAAPGFAQAPASAPRPAPAPAAPPAAPVAAPNVPFPQGAKIGVVNLQLIAQLSNEGKSATAKIQALIQKKQTEGAAKTKLLQDNQMKLEQSGALMNEAARTQLTKDIERQTLEGQRFEQDAQAEVTELQTNLQNEFQKKLFPILEAIRKEKDLQILLSAQESGAIVIEPGIDLTNEAVKRLDAQSTTPAAAAPK
jgi:outer membrane protein